MGLKHKISLRAKKCRIEPNYPKTQVETANENDFYNGVTAWPGVSRA